MAKILLTALAVFFLVPPPQPCVAQESNEVAHQPPTEPAFGEQVVELDGPRFQITNRSESPIVAFVMVQPASSSTLAGRFYYDACTDGDYNKPIAQGASATVPLGYFEGTDLSKVRGEARAVIFQDGSTAGESAWVNALFARRIRHYDRLRRVHDLLVEQIHAGLTSEEIVEKLQAAKADFDRQPLKLELRHVDDLVLDSAIHTLQLCSREPDTDRHVKWYAEHLGEQLNELERCGPGMGQDKRALLADHPVPDGSAIPTH